MSVLVVSHDRHLSRHHRKTSCWWPTARSKVRGDLDDYRALADRNTACAKRCRQQHAVNRTKPTRKPSATSAAALSQQLAPHNARSRQAGSRMGKVHERLAKIEASMGDSAVTRRARKDELRLTLLAEAGPSSSVREGQLENGNLGWRPRTA